MLRFRFSGPFSKKTAPEEAMHTRFSEKLIRHKQALLVQRSRPQTMNRNTKRIAAQRIKTLFTLAKQTSKQDPTLAQHYINTARKIAMATKTKLPPQYKRQICKHCKTFILPGVNCRIRINQTRQPHITITCLNCKKQTRIPITKKEKNPKT